jgi:hypothetical protein
MSTNALAIARDLLSRGYNPVPVSVGKHPISKNWQHVVITDENIGRYFNGKALNVGVQMGRASGGLIDVDLDCPEAVKLAPYFLPPTKLIYGRPGKRKSADYWTKLWGWINAGGDRHVAAYLHAYDLTRLDPKAPPPKTRAFWEIVDANRASEDAELADVLDRMKNPNATTLAAVIDHTTFDCEINAWLRDRKNRRVIPYRMEAIGYVPIRNPDADDGLWKISTKRQAVYAKKTLSIRDQLQAAQTLARAAGQSNQ